MMKYAKDIIIGIDYRPQGFPRWKRGGVFCETLTASMEELRKQFEYDISILGEFERNIKPIIIV